MRPAGAPMTAGQLLELEVGSAAAGGGCVALAPDGRVVFVRHCLPGEIVRARLTSVGSRFCRADALEILTASPYRVEPACPHAGPGRCGGCDYQHADLAIQRAMKAQLVTEAFRRIARVELDAAFAVEPVGSADGLGWRSRVRFGIDRSGRAGLRRHRSTELEPVSACPIAAARVEAVGVERRRWRGASEVEVFAPAGGRALLAVRPRPGAVPELPELGERGPEVEIAVGASPAGGGERPAVRADGAGLAFRVSAGSFWQVHVDAPAVLVEALLDALAPAPGERAVDLHAGVGLFAAHLARAVGPAGSVLAVERSAVACADAEVNTAGLGQVEVRCAEVTAETVAGLAPFDLLVLDPPRAGAGVDVLVALAARTPPPRRTAYLSCDPASLARDLRGALGQGWTLASLRAFDLFPMTEHVELLAVLEPPPRG